MNLNRTLRNINISKKSFFNFKEERNWINIDTLKLHLNYYYLDMGWGNNNIYVNCVDGIYNYGKQQPYISFKYNNNKQETICIFKNVINFNVTSKKFLLFL